MRIGDMNWMQVEAYLQRDDRCVLPLGSTEQHAYLSLSVDSILAERVAVEAAEPLGIPVFPVVAYGMTPMFRAYPGTVSVRIETYIRLVRDLLDSIAGHGFRRILIVNGHGGNSPVQGMVSEWLGSYAGTRVQFHNWWSAPLTMGQVQTIDPIASHASWMENFPWTRLAGVPLPDQQKAPVNLDQLRQLGADESRQLLGDGNFAGYYQRSDDDMLAVWKVAIAETRALLENWA
jgi:creatinine amidohydrolase